jgi:hypothetical protein
MAGVGTFKFLMLNCWPVIVRELRAEARRPTNYWLRVFGAAAFLVAFWLAVSRDAAATPARFAGVTSNPIGQLGQVTFGYLNVALFATIWLLGPLMTADCLSREKREATLGLLFLTPLTAGGVVIGKSLTHGVRALTFCLTALPVLVVPLVFGGVSGEDILLAVFLDGGALCLALAAGLLASAMAKDWVKTVLIAELLSLIFGLWFMAAHQRGFEQALAATGPAPPGRLAPLVFGRFGQGLVHPPGFFSQCAERFAWCTDEPAIHMAWAATPFGLRGMDTFGGRWTQVWTGTPAALHRQWLSAAGGLAARSFLVLALAVAAASWHVRRSWRAEPPSARQLWWREFFCTPRYYQALFQRRMRGLLEHNPVGWLQQYTWSARLTKWGWTLVVIVAELFFLADPSLNDLVTGQSFLAVLLLLSLGFSAASSFQRERETGALELLLVSPLRVNQILQGRISGLWRQFFLPVFLLLTAWVYVYTDSAFGQLSAAWEPRIQHYQFPILLVGAYFTLPMVGLYFSLRRGNVMLAWLLTASSGLFLPIVVFLIFPVLSTMWEPNSVVWGIVFFQVCVAWVTGWLAWRHLAQRRFLSL